MLIEIISTLKHRHVTLKLYVSPFINFHDFEEDS